MESKDPNSSIVTIHKYGHNKTHHNYFLSSAFKIRATFLKLLELRLSHLKRILRLSSQKILAQKSYYFLVDGGTKKGEGVVSIPGIYVRAYHTLGTSQTAEYLLHHMCATKK